jgi:DNA-binding IclR family transcriptional regulator
LKALDSALRILLEFSKDSGRLSVSDLCSRTGLKKSQISKILASFRNNGVLAQDPRTREYSVGLRTVTLAGQYLKGNSLSREALGPMRRLVNLSEHTATLCVLDGLDVMYLLAVESERFIDHGWRAGSYIPFHATAAGKVLVAYLAEDESDRIIALKGLPRFTSTTICHPSALKQQFQQIRKTGVAITHSEGTPGGGARAVPVFGEQQRVIAALGLVYPYHLVSDKVGKTMTQMLHVQAQMLSLRMGARIYPYGNSKGAQQAPALRVSKLAS